MRRHKKQLDIRFTAKAHSLTRHCLKTLLACIILSHDLANLSSNESLLVRTVKAFVRALITQQMMGSSDAQCNTEESP